LEIYNNIYVKEYGLVELIKFPFYRSFGGGDKNIDYKLLEIILNSIGILDVVLNANPCLILELKNCLHYCKFINACMYLINCTRSQFELKSVISEILNTNDNMVLDKSVIDAWRIGCDIHITTQGISHIFNEFELAIRSYYNIDIDSNVDNGAVATKTILFLASNPTETAVLQQRLEFAEIHRRMQDSKIKYNIFSEFAVNPIQLQRAIFLRKPNIIHFSGHGVLGDKKLIELGESLGINIEDGAGLIVQNERSENVILSNTALSELFQVATNEMKIDLVVLNACYSSDQADAIKQYVPFVIGSKSSIDIARQ